MGQHGLGQFHNAENVDIVKLTDLLHAEIFQKAAQAHAGKVYDGVNASGFADDGVHGAIDVRPAGHVHAQGGDCHIAAGGLPAQFLFFGFGESRSIDTKIAGGQVQGGSQPQAGARASDQYNGSIVSHAFSHSVGSSRWRRAASCC